jgi:uncharacterized protein YidB (DUF937 family)
MSNLTDLVENLAKQSLGDSSDSSQSGLGGVLGSVLGNVLNQGGSQTTTNTGSGLGGILSSVLGSLAQNSATSSEAKSSSGLLVAVLPLILNWIQQQGGLQGALATLQNAGLAEQLSTWLQPESSHNAPVAQQDIASLFDASEVEQLAQQQQTNTASVHAAIASVLPQIIDALTPDGPQSDAQQANTDVAQLLSKVSTLLR